MIYSRDVFFMQLYICICEQIGHKFRPRLAIVTSDGDFVTVFLLLQPLTALCAHLKTVCRIEHQQSCLNMDLQFKFSEENNALTLHLAHEVMDRR